MRRNLAIILIVLSGIVCLSFKFPDDPVKRINQALHKFFIRYPQEKIHILFDKEFYAPGETIWFHGWATNTSSLTPISKIVYTELVDEQGAVIKKLVLPVDSSGLTGSINIPAETKGGNYYVRAYTAWMLNFNPAFFFYKKIIIEAADNPAPRLQNPSAGKDFTIRFFPEGGNMVQRLTSMVAFKAIQSNGLPVSITGKIVDSDGETVALLNTMHDGMGRFAIHCSSKKTYSAIVTANGITKTFTLPIAKPSGIVLYTRHETDSTNDNIYFHLSRSILNKEQYEDLIICAQMENHVTFSRIRFNEATAGDPVDTILEANTLLPLNGFPPGIVHLTIFNDSAQALAERLFFLNPKLISKDTRIETKTDASLPNSNNFLLHFPEHFTGQLSVSIIDANIHTDESSSFISDHFLSSDIEGYIHNPAWYFNNMNDEKIAALDLLLMTHKWSRFKWSDLLNNKFPETYYEPQQSISLKGQVVLINKQNKTPYANKDVVMTFSSPKDSLNQLVNVPTDSSGHFSLEGLNFHDTATMIVYNEMGDKKISKKVSVEFFSNMNDTVFSPSFTAAECPANPFYTGSSTFKPGRNKNYSQLNDSTLRTKSEVLDSVTVRAKPKTHLDTLLSRYASGPFASANAWAETMDFTNDKQAELRDWQNVFEYTRNKIKGLQYFYDTEKNEHIVVWRMSSSLLNTTISEADRYRDNAPAFFVNEVLLNSSGEQYSNAYQTLTSLSMSQVAMIRIFQPGSLPVVPENGPHGAIVIYTKNGTELTQQPLSKSISFDKAYLRGYSPVKKFNSASSFSAATGNSINNKATLYWNEHINIDSTTHTAKFIFDNDSSIKKYRIIVEGIDQKGNPFYYNKPFEK
jgi:hypothetical protein